MGLDNPIHIAFLLILLLLVFGAKRLPEMGRSLGTGMRGFKETLSGEHTHTPLNAHQHAPATTTATTTTARATIAEPVGAPVAAPVATPTGEPRAPVA
jgi:sec-independent protein translocase protein TatA